MTPTVYVVDAKGVTQTWTGPTTAVTVDTTGGSLECNGLPQHWSGASGHDSAPHGLRSQRTPSHLHRRLR